MSAYWRHNGRESRWELGYDDIPRQKFVVAAWVTDEMIDHVADPAMLTRRTMESAGSVPPPLREYLPPSVPIVMS